MNAFVNGEGQPRQAPVKYAAYKPKRHSRTNSVGNSTFSSSTSTMPIRTATSPNSAGMYMNVDVITPNTTVPTIETSEPPVSGRAPSGEQGLPAMTNQEEEEKPIASSTLAKAPSESLTPEIPSPSPASRSLPTLSSTAASTSIPIASSSSSASTFRPYTVTHTSTFRRVRPPTSSPLARPNSVILAETSKRSSNVLVLSAPTSPTRLNAPDIPLPVSPDLNSVPVAGFDLHSPSRSPVPAPSVLITSPADSSYSPSAAATTKSTLSTPTSAPAPAPTPTSTSTPSAVSKLSKLPKAPYRPGFQPTGLTRFRTDEFLAARKVARDGPGGRLDKRVERTKLERRLEKIIRLHFPESDALLSKDQGEKTEKGEVGSGKAKNVKEKELEDKEKKDSRLALSANGKLQRPGLLGSAGDTRRRTSSFFETFDIRRMSSSFIGGVGLAEEESVRSSEQRITPWQPDSAASRCPHCDVSFHPLSNRKHHCRLCGRVVCALPVKRGERIEPCSFLFVVDPKTRLIEQVEEGVDYGVRKRKHSSVDLRPQEQRIANQDTAEDEEEKFLKGVRICRECNPVLRRQQYLRERTPGADKVVGEFLTLYEALIGLEKEIEERLLPRFEEMLDVLNKSKSSNETNTLDLSGLPATAAAERKRLLQAFARYDALAKRIRSLPTSSDGKQTRMGGSRDVKKEGGMSSKERVQAAIAVRAARFLEVRMVGLGVVPAEHEREQKHKRNASNSNSNSNSRSSSSPSSTADPSSVGAQTTLRTHKTLQPLLEQESLLESYVTEATKARKFEDAKILRGNLREIREEIERVVEGNSTR
ncbi:FYVE zinc finger-domain-containing protein [Lentinula detonsa]|uniref:FYVE zinc finger-domain-containing protein n=1 Tax=Lentinula detonsa TaxID=2804962 RepID=A0A9W8NVJ1_9AGAR|nr:FYVE zinc finger-domain-containing protein [Lentinula detonsa]